MGKPYAGREPDARCCWTISTTRWVEKKAELVGGPAAAGGGALAVMLDTCTLAVFTKMNSSAGSHSCCGERLSHALSELSEGRAEIPGSF